MTLIDLIRPRPTPIALAIPLVILATSTAVAVGLAVTLYKPARKALRAVTEGDKRSAQLHGRLRLFLETETAAAGYGLEKRKLADEFSRAYRPPTETPPAAETKRVDAPANHASEAHDDASNDGSGDACCSPADA